MKYLRKLLLISLLIVGLLVLAQPFGDAEGQDVTSTPTPSLTNTPTVPPPPTDPPTNTPEPTATDTALPSPTDTAIATDTVTPTEIPWTVYADTHPDIDYRGGVWTVQADNQALQGTVTLTPDTNAQMTVRFNGTGIALLYVANNAGGSFRGKLDNGAPQHANGHVVNAIYQSRLEFADLPAGEHTLVVTNQQGTLMVEAVEIQGQILPTLLPEPSPTEDRRRYTFCHVAGNAQTVNYILMENMPYASLRGHFNEDGTPANGHPLDFIIAGPDVPLSGLGVADCAPPIALPSETPTATAEPSATASLTPSPTVEISFTPSPNTTDTPSPTETEAIEIERILPTAPEPMEEVTPEPPTATPTATPDPCTATEYNIAAGDNATLIAAIECANLTRVPTTINLAPGAVYTFSNPYSSGSALPTITGHVTLDGNGATLTKANQTTPLRFTGVYGSVVKPASLIINNLRMDGANLASPSTGGALTNNTYGTLTITNSVIQNILITSAGSGGAINSGGTLYLDNTVIKNVNVTYVAGHTGTAIMSSKSLTILNSRFENNTVYLGYGTETGTIRTTANTLIENSVFINNTTGVGGGVAIYAGSLFPGEPVIIRYSTFRNNSTQHGGAGVYVSGGATTHDIDINDNCFIDNTGDSVVQNANSNITVDATNNGWYPQEITDGNVTTGGGGPSWCGPNQEPSTQLVVNTYWGEDYGFTFDQSVIGLQADTAYTETFIDENNTTGEVEIPIEENTAVQVKMVSFPDIPANEESAIEVGIRQTNYTAITPPMNLVSIPVDEDGIAWYSLDEVQLVLGAEMQLPAANNNNIHLIEIEVFLCRNGLSSVSDPLLILPICGADTSLTLHMQWGLGENYTLSGGRVSANVDDYMAHADVTDGIAGPVAIPITANSTAQVGVVSLPAGIDTNDDSIYVAIEQVSAPQGNSGQEPPEGLDWIPVALIYSTQYAITLPLANTEGEHDIYLNLFMCDTEIPASTPTTTASMYSMVIFIGGTLVASWVVRRKKKANAVYRVVQLGIFVMVIGIVLVACGPLEPDATPCPEDIPTITPIVVGNSPTPTPIVTDTQTPIPTATTVPPTPTLLPSATPIGGIDCNFNVNTPPANYTVDQIATCYGITFSVDLSQGGDGSIIWDDNHKQDVITAASYMTNALHTLPSINSSYGLYPQLFKDLLGSVDFVLEGDNSGETKCKAEYTDVNGYHLIFYVGSKIDSTNSACVNEFTLVHELGHGLRIRIGKTKDNDNITDIHRIDKYMRDTSISYQSTSLDDQVIVMGFINGVWTRGSHGWSCEAKYTQHAQTDSMPQDERLYEAFSDMTLHWVYQVFQDTSCANPAPDIYNDPEFTPGTRRHNYMNDMLDGLINHALSN